MKEKWVVVMLFSIILPFCMSFASAADPASNHTVTADQKTVAQHTTTNKNIKQIQNVQMAAGEATSYSNNTSTAHKATVSITQSQLKSAASSVKSFINKNGRLPNYVTIAGNQISMPQYLQLIAQGSLDIKNGQKFNLILKDVGLPKSPKDAVQSGTIGKTEYLKMAENILNFMHENGSAPSYIKSSIGKVKYESLVFIFSKILVFDNDNGRLPNYVSVDSGTNQAAGSPSSSYLATTKNCQVTSTTIRSLARSITAGKSSAYSKAKAIFNWVRDHLSYQFYYNTKKGALGALSSRSANCCDTAHLVVALARAAGIPARYRYGTCDFPNGWFGHVWAQLYVNGCWHNADAVSNSNTLGAINNWNWKTYKLHATYTSLPF